MTQDILFSEENHIGLVTLNRPAALNALTLPMIKTLLQQLQAWADDSRIHAVVVQAVAGKAFCAGGDVRWLYDSGQKDDPEQLQFFYHEYRLNHAIHHYNKPYIALMDGITMGGGVGIALHGAYPIASERFVFAMPETALGFFPDIGASYLLARCPDNAGVYLGLTGNRLNAADAYALNLVKAVVPSDNMSELVHLVMATDLSQQAPQRVEACIRQVATPSYHAPIEALLPDIRSCFQSAEVERILQALAGNANPWCQETLATLKTKSPLSLKVTLSQIKKAGNQSLAECLQMDYCLVHHFMQGSDFYEGVRALLIDKDKSPQWRPKTLEEVTPEQVAGYFHYCNEGHNALSISIRSGL